MPDRIPVFDDWGNKVGDFIPEGGGLGSLAGLVLAIVFLWIIGFFFYAIYKLIADGIKAAKEGKWIKAIVYLAIVWLPSLIIIVGSIVGTVQESQKSSQKQQYLQHLSENYPVKIMKAQKKKCVQIQVDENTRSTLSAWEFYTKDANSICVILTIQNDSGEWDAILYPSKNSGLTEDFYTWYLNNSAPSSLCGTDYVTYLWKGNTLTETCLKEKSNPIDNVCIDTGLLAGDLYNESAVFLRKTICTKPVDTVR